MTEAVQHNERPLSAARGYGEAGLLLWGVRKTADGEWELWHGESGETLGMFDSASDALREAAARWEMPAAALSEWGEVLQPR